MPRQPKHIIPALLLFALFLPSGILAAPARPFPQHVHYVSGTTRPSPSQDVLDRDVRTFYSRWKADYLVGAGTAPDGTTMYRIIHSKANPGETVSEGQGYGMIITTIMAGVDPDAQKIVNGLWKFARQHPSTVDSRLMAWQVPEDPNTGIDAAFDGDADMAFALLMAHNQWGSDGLVNYRQEGLNLLAAIGQSMIGPLSRLPLLGDWINRAGTEPKYNQYTPRSSDFMPGHFRAWHRITGNPLWREVLTSVQNAISQVQQDHSPTTGLLSDFLEPVSATDHRLKPVPANFLEGPDDGHYEYNAGRDPWRIGTDALQSGDPLSLAQTRKIADWIYTATGGNAANIKDGYMLDGTPLRPNDDFTTFFAAPFGVAMMTRPAYQNFLDNIYNRVKARHEDYFEDSVNLLCMLVMSGNFWSPEPDQVQPPNPGSGSGKAVIAPLTLLLFR